MKAIYKSIFLFELVFIILSCSKQNKTASYFLEKDDIVVIESVKKFNYFEKDDYNKVIAILDEAIERKPYIWEFYNYKIITTEAFLSTAYENEDVDYDTIARQENKIIIESFEKYIPNKKNELTVSQNFLYGFNLLYAKRNKEAQKYLKESYKFLSTIKNPPEYGSDKENSLGCAVISGFLLSKISEEKLKKYDFLFINNEFLYKSFLALVKNETPESLIEKYGNWSF